MDEAHFQGWNMEPVLCISIIYYTFHVHITHSFLLIIFFRSLPTLQIPPVRSSPLLQMRRRGRSGLPAVRRLRTAVKRCRVKPTPMSQRVITFFLPKYLGPDMCTMYPLIFPEHFNFLWAGNGSTQVWLNSRKSFRTMALCLYVHMVYQLPFSRKGKLLLIKKNSEDKLIFF